MKEKDIIKECLNDLSIALLKHFAKMFGIKAFEKLNSEELVISLVNLIYEQTNSENSIYSTIKSACFELKNILINHFNLISTSDNKFQKELEKLTEKFKYEQEQLIKAYDMQLQEFISNPANYALYSMHNIN